MPDTLWNCKEPFSLMVSRTFMERSGLTKGIFLSILKAALETMTEDCWDQNKKAVEQGNLGDLDCWTQTIVGNYGTQQVEIIPYHPRHPRMLVMGLALQPDTMAWFKDEKNTYTFTADQMRKAIAKGPLTPFAEQFISDGQHRRP